MLPGATGRWWHRVKVRPTLQLPQRNEQRVCRGGGIWRSRNCFVQAHGENEVVEQASGQDCVPRADVGFAW